MEEKIYGLLGRKLGHSWSVPIHESLGCRGYRLLEREPSQLKELLCREDLGGLNVTIPYKRDVMAFCDVIAPAAAAIGSVNTLVRREDGKLYGYNTDIDGFLYTARRSGITFAGKKVLVLGSGGASLTAQAAARQEGAREVVVISRSGPNTYENLDRHGDAEVLVNTTPVGMWPHLEGQCVSLSRLPGIESVIDVIYNPCRTNLLLQAEERESGASRIRRAGGLPMLVAQAVAAEELFFSRAIDASETERILSSLWQDRTNIVLVGMPGCGKTTVGKALARLSGRTFTDLDEVIVQKAGCSIPEFFAREGEAGFRELERQILQETAAKSGQILATGGGAVLLPENRAAMRRTGRVYFLRRDLGVLPTAGRPLSQSGRLEEMYQVRLPLYTAAADAVIDNSASPKESAAEIWRDFCAYSGH